MCLRVQNEHTGADAHDTPFLQEGGCSLYPMSPPEAAELTHPHAPPQGAALTQMNAPPCVAQ